MTAFDVSCPSCRATLTISPEAQRVVSHKEAPAPKTVTDLAEAARRLEEERNRRHALFNESVENQKTKGDKLNKSFNDLLKRAKDEPVERPARDMDLD